MVKVPVPYTGARAVHVGRGGTGNGAEQGGGENGHLGRAALGTTGEQAGQIHEQGTHVGLFQKRAEHDEGIDHACGRRQGHAIDAVGGQKELFKKVRGVDAVVAQPSGQILPEEGVQDEHHGNDDQGKPRRAPRDLKHEKHAAYAHEPVHVGQRIHIAQPVHDIVVFHDDVRPDGQRQHRKTQIQQEHGQGFLAVLVAEGGTPEKNQRHDERQMRAALYGRGQNAEPACGIDLKQCQNDSNN